MCGEKKNNERNIKKEHKENTKNKSMNKINHIILTKIKEQTQINKH